MVGLLAPARGQTAWPYRCLAPQLVPSWTSFERKFGQCSPSLSATASTRQCNLSQVAARPTILTKRVGNDARTLGPIQAAL